MSRETGVSKKELRKYILKKRDALTMEERKKKSAAIAKRVISHRAFQEADNILLFASYKSEVDTVEIFRAARKAQKAVYYPKVNGSEMEFYLVEQETELLEGYRGIREPADIPGRRFGIFCKSAAADGGCADALTSPDLDELNTLVHLYRSDNRSNLCKWQKICIIMPGAVFDEDGNRIGYGGGYYDKYLERLEQMLSQRRMHQEQELPEKYLCKMAVAFECQMVDKGEIPNEAYDVKVDCVFTENRIILLDR